MALRVTRNRFRDAAQQRRRKGMLLGLALALGCTPPALAHNRGLYKTQAEAEQRAKELGCHGSHQNQGLWLPCSSESSLHKELRQP